MREYSLPAFARQLMRAERMRDLAAQRQFERDCDFAEAWSSTGVMPTMRQPSMFDEWVGGGCRSERCSGSSTPTMTGLEGTSSEAAREAWRAALASAGMRSQLQGVAASPTLVGLGSTLVPSSPSIGSGLAITSSGACSNVGSGLPILLGVRLPDFAHVWEHTKDCFEDAGYARVDWPETSCCPPTVAVSASCPLPSADEVAEADGLLWASRPDPGELDFDMEGLDFIPAEDEALFNAAFALLRKHRDIVDWLLCLYVEWAPEFGYTWPYSDFLPPPRDLMELLLDAGMNAWFIANFVDNSGDPTGTTGAAATVFEPSAQGELGVVVTTRVGGWPGWSVEYATGLDDASALCAVVKAAGLILHEMAHILFDGFGGSHDEGDDCWDAARMVGTGFEWAMSQVYPCTLAASTGCCAEMDEQGWFFYSLAKSQQDC